MSVATCIYALFGLTFGIALVGAVVGWWKDLDERGRECRGSE